MSTNTEFIYNSCLNYNKEEFSNLLIDFKDRRSSILADLIKLDNNMVFPPGNTQKIIQYYCKKMRDNNIRKPLGCFIDLPKVITQKETRELLMACQQIKRGYVYDLRYKTKEWEMYRLLNLKVFGFSLMI